jgi:hypothetical protein
VIVTRVAAWLGVHRDRLAAGWYRFTDSLAAGWDRFADRLAGWDRFADRLAAGWYRFTDARWGRFADGLADRKERVLDLLVTAPYRLNERLRRGNLRAARPNRARAGRPLADLMMALSLVSIIGLASVGVLSALREDTGDGSRAANASADEPGESSDGTPEHSGGAGTSSDAGSSDPVDQLGAFRVHRDERTGYSFSYPSGWELSVSGAITRLVDPDSGVTLSFRPAPAGSIQALSEQLLEGLSGRYGELDLLARDLGETPAGEPSLVVGGRSSGADGSPINFLVVTIAGPGENRSVTVRFNADTEMRRDLLSSIRHIVGSYRAIADATET